MKYIRLLPVIFSLLLPITSSSVTVESKNTDKNLQVETIKLHYLLAEDVIPLIKPFLHNSGLINGKARYLLIKTTPENLDEIKKFISDLDVPPKNLIITVTIDDEVTQKQDTGIKRYTTAKRQNEPATLQVHTLEGQWASINTGELAPIAEEKRRHGGTVTYKSITAGFQARVRLHGDKVTIELIPKLHSNNPQGGGRINTQEAKTTVSGQTGKWIPIGGVVQTQSQKRGVKTYSTDLRKENQNRIYVKVDVQK